jgi:putative flavodoxin
MKACVIYFTTSGNTEMLAESLAEGLRSKAEVELKKVSEADSLSLSDFDIIALGSPAQGTEEIDETEMKPFYDSHAAELKGKKVILFGCFGWGDGAFLDTWKEDVVSNGGVVIKTYGNLETPEADALAEIKAIGENA